MGLVKVVVCLIGQFTGHISNTYVTNARAAVVLIGHY